MSVEREAFEGAGMLLTGLETLGLPGTEAGEVESWRLQQGKPAEAVRGLRLWVEGAPKRRLRCPVDTG